MYEAQLEELLDFSLIRLSDVEPSAWAESRMKITSGKFQGPLSYDLTPYHREIINCLSPYHPACEVVLMGGSQIGKTKTIIEPSIGYYISEHPCEIGYLTGHSDLSDESMMKLDSAIDNAGLNGLIFKQSLRKNNKQTGDTLRRKEFPMGSLVAGSASNHRLLRQRTWKFGILDDIEAAKSASKESGDTITMIRKRFHSYGNERKIFWCSTPERRDNSIIEGLFLQGDQRRYHIPCQCCGELIYLKWENFIYDFQNDELIPGSVRYLCQTCGDAFDDTNKYEFNLAGKWIATAKAKNPQLVSFHLPSWYAPPGMDRWEDNVREYLAACPPGQPVNKRLLQTFQNLTAGETYEDEFEEIKASKLQENINDYEPWIIPEKLSLDDGNGRIVLITCAADVNGLEDDGRLDWVITAWPETQSPYTIAHGSIGTFKPAALRRKGDEQADRVKWTYEENKPHCIWDEFEKLLRRDFVIESDIARRTKINIGITGIDTGVYKNHVLTFVEKMNNRGLCVRGVKGKGSGEYTLFLHNEHKVEKDARVISKSKANPAYEWILDVGYLKDDLHSAMQLNWGRNEEVQPTGFLNFPHPGGGIFEWANFFEHFESEKRVYVENKKGTNVVAQWVKKQSGSQNHMWDCFIYNMALKDIWIEVLRDNYPEQRKEINWKMYAEFTRRNIESLRAGS